MDGVRFDHGQFAIQTPLDRELRLIHEAWERARENRRHPGHHWHRIVARRPGDGGEPEVTKLYHVDRNAALVEITETRNGTETARRTIRLDRRD